MSTNPKSYAGFQGKYPLLVTFDSDGTPPMLERIESKFHYDDDFYMDPPPYPPSEAYPSKQFPRINRKNPPPECYFVRPIVDYKVTIGPKFAIPMKQLRNKLRDLRLRKWNGSRKILTQRMIWLISYWILRI